MDDLRPRVSRGLHGVIDAFRHLVIAYQDEDEVAHLPTPPSVTLLNLASVLAGMEAVAIAGTQSEAVRWHRWVEAHLPSHVETCMEWPVSVRRVRALLLARTGDVKRATTLMREAVAWADEKDYRAEAAIARLQLAELLAASPTTSSQREWSRTRHAGREQARALGIPHVPHAYAATRAAALGQFVTSRPMVTPREAEVLELLARGLSYRQIGAELGIGWRTAQSHAYHVYEKLGASGKMAAVSIARDLGIL
jgi:ATP/maltotriose-dependent transcriptional regulator MalT